MVVVVMLQILAVAEESLEEAQGRQTLLEGAAAMQDFQLRLAIEVLEVEVLVSFLAHLKMAQTSGTPAPHVTGSWRAALAAGEVVAWAERSLCLPEGSRRKVLVLLPAWGYYR